MSKPSFEVKHRQSRADPESAVRSALTVERHVLVIDDEIDIAEPLADMVKKLGFSATVATSGDAAKICLKTTAQPVDAILCDLRMPGGDGPSFYDWLRQNHPTLTECIGFIPGDTLGPAAGRFLARSGCPMIEKPFVFEDNRRVCRRAGGGPGGLAAIDTGQAGSGSRARVR
jgi:two-component system NtrC family sensor kinase